MNGGFGLLLDGSEGAAKRASLMLNWDVSNGVRVQRNISMDSSKPRCSQLALTTWLTVIYVFLCIAGGTSLLVGELERL